MTLQKKKLETTIRVLSNVMDTKAKTETYVSLPEIVEINGAGIPELTSKLIERTRIKAIYERWDNVWEVFKIKIAPAEEICGRKYPKREVYPCNEDFGKTAWAFNSEKRARMFYNRI